MILLVIGTVIDGIPGLIMTVPILLPIATDVYHIDPRHFGVVVVVNLVLTRRPRPWACPSSWPPPSRRQAGEDVHGHHALFPSSSRRTGAAVVVSGLSLGLLEVTQPTERHPP